MVDEKSDGFGMRVCRESKRFLHNTEYPFSPYRNLMHVIYKLINPNPGMHLSPVLHFGECCFCYFTIHCKWKLQ